MRAQSLRASFAFALALSASLFLVTWDLPGPGLAWADAVWCLYVGAIGFAIVRRGEVSRWRAVFFITLAAFFLLRYRTAIFGLSACFETEGATQRVMRCYVSIVPNLLNVLRTNYLSLQSQGVLYLGAFWILFTLLIGRAWCSWICFYGGIDEFFSRLLEAPKLDVSRLPKILRFVPPVLLLVLALLSLATLTPVFCRWLCPLKLELVFLPFQPSRTVGVILAATVGLLFLVVLPILTKKRTFCSFICPFGAWQTLLGKLSIFRVRIEKGGCLNCDIRMTVCPHILPIPENSGENHVIHPSCFLCGDCVDACPGSAIHYTVLGFAGKGLFSAHALFIFTALLFGGTVGAAFVPEVIARLPVYLFHAVIGG